MMEVTGSIPMADSWKLNKEIDFENVNEQGQTIHRHLGSIAMSMTDWEGSIADELGLTEPDRVDIYQGRYALNPGMRRSCILQQLPHSQKFLPREFFAFFSPHALMGETFILQTFGRKFNS